MHDVFVLLQQFDDDETHGPSEAATYLSQSDPLLTVSEQLNTY